jgi:hypothetical protein
MPKRKTNDQLYEELMAKHFIVSDEASTSKLEEKPSGITVEDLIDDVFIEIFSMLDEKSIIIAKKVCQR